MSKKYFIAKDIVGMVEEAGKPIAAIVNVDGHQLFFTLREMRGDAVIELLQAIAQQQTNEENE